MAQFKIGDAVKIKFSTLTGVIFGASLDQTTLEIQYGVEYTDNNDEQQSRYFKDCELEAVA